MKLMLLLLLLLILLILLHGHLQMNSVQNNVNIGTYIFDSPTLPCP